MYCVTMECYSSTVVVLLRLLSIPAYPATCRTFIGVDLSPLDMANIPSMFNIFNNLDMALQPTNQRTQCS